jgi:hypothetical protein
LISLTGETCPLEITTRPKTFEIERDVYIGKLPCSKVTKRIPNEKRRSACLPEPDEEYETWNPEQTITGNADFIANTVKTNMSCDCSR